MARIPSGLFFYSQTERVKPRIDGRNNAMREQELEYLRNELNQNLNFYGEHAYKLIGNIILIWGGTLVLSSVKEGGFLEDISTLFIIATIFFFSIVVLYLLSCRNFENLKTIAKIAAYITIFYEKHPKYEKDENIFWELSRFEIRDKEMKKQKMKYNKLNKELNNGFRGEYLGLSIIALCVIFIIGIKSFFLLNSSNHFMIFAFILCIVYAASSIFFSVRINTISSLVSKECPDIKKSYLKRFLDYAIKNGYYDNDEEASKKEAENRLGKYVFDEIYNYKAEEEC